MVFVSRPEPGSLTIFGISITVIGYIAIGIFMLAYISLVIRTKKNKRKN